MAIEPLAVGVCSWSLQVTSIPGRAVVWTGTKEVAELKLEQIRSFHETRSDGTKFGPLGCTIEPAPG